MEQTTHGTYAPCAGFGELIEKTIAPHVLTQMPDYDVHEIQPAIDSACMTPQHWHNIAAHIIEYYDDYAGFVVLHGTDTLAYTASMLSFLLQGVTKSVIVTGSQIPLIEPCSDAHNNLLVSMQLCAKYAIPEVSVYFANQLLRGNRVVKTSTSSMIAFESANYPPLATFENHLKIHQRNWLTPSEPSFVNPTINSGQVATLYLAPTMPNDMIEHLLAAHITGLVIVSYGAGNIPSDNQTFIDNLHRAQQQGIVMVNVSQCLGGEVSLDYEAARPLSEAGVVNGADMTIEAAVTKLNVLLATEPNNADIRRKLTENLAGELTKH